MTHYCILGYPNCFLPSHNPGRKLRANETAQVVHAEPERIYLSVPLSHVRNVKAVKSPGMRAAWDPQAKKWFVYNRPGIDLTPFTTWLPAPSGSIFLNASKNDVAAIKAVGTADNRARFDWSCYKWYVSPDMDLTPFAKWLPENLVTATIAVSAQPVTVTRTVITQARVMTPEENAKLLQAILAGGEQEEIETVTITSVTKLTHG